MSASSATRDTVAPPHSPLSTQSHLSPRLLTPDPDASFPLTSGFDSLTFTKQPIPRPSAPGRRSVPYSPLTESEASDGHVSEAHQPHSAPKGQHLSLLSAILSSPDAHAPNKEARKVSVPTAGLISGTSNPPTTLSSPAHKEPHGILQKSQPPSQTQAAAPPTIGALLPSSILRRESSDATASDSTDAHIAVEAARRDPDGLNSLAGMLKKVEEKREKIGWADEVPKDAPSTAALARAPSTASSVGPRPRLHFAVAHPPSLGSTSASEAGDNGSRRPSSAAASSRRPSSPFAKERKVQESLDEQSDDNIDDDIEDDDEVDESTPGEFGRLHGYASRSTSSSGRRSEELQSPIDEDEDEDDLGYQEDEEDGMFSDEEETTGFDLSGDIFKPKFAFARSTNYTRGRRMSRDDLSPATTPPPAPAWFPPPNRRGRGHVRVADPPPAVAVTTKKGCSRHCSPPPSASASGRSRSESKAETLAPPAVASPSARFLKRSESVAGPSKQRIVGSPMPPRRLAMEDEDDDEEDENEEEGEDAQEEEDDDTPEREPVAKVDTPPKVRSGWRSDDAMFQASARLPSRAIKPFVPIHPRPNRPAPAYKDRPPVFEEESDEGDSVAESIAREVLLDEESSSRDRSRRASEQMPMFRRPSVVAPTLAFDRNGEGSRTAPLPTQATVPPALDYTPVHRSSFSRASEDEGGLTYRLGKTLSGSSNAPSLAPPLARETIGTSPKSTISFTPSVTPANPPETLQRAPSNSGRVTFQPAEKPVRSGAPQRAVSGASHFTASQAQRREAEQDTSKGRISGNPGPAPGAERAGVARAVSASAAPIRCPKRTSQKEDLGWTDEALMSIRKQVGKGVDMAK